MSKIKISITKKKKRDYKIVKVINWDSIGNNNINNNSNHKISIVQLKPLIYKNKIN